jgi:Sulfotransferase family
VAPLPGHVLRCAVVLEDVRLLYVPVPKAGCTTILRALAGVAGLSEDELARSRKLEVTRDLAIHDPAVWGESYTLESRSPEEVERILDAPDWLRFTVVRAPLRRLWSAWVSKVLVREPRFVAAFGREDWFPTAPRSSHDVLAWFRRFVDALPSRDDELHDPHWSRQADLLGVRDLGYDHVGHIERVEQSVAVVDAHLRAHGRALPPLRLANRSLLPYVPGLFDQASLDACASWTASAHEAFGYEPPAGDPEPPDDAWHATVEAAIPGIQAVIERHERIADLRSLVREVELAAA